MGRRLVLKASAGTGKTYRLSLEYIISLAQGIDFRDILVMTFTKKATAEIRERILKFLSQICENKEEKDELEKNIQNIYDKNFVFDIEKMEKIYRDLMENKDRLHIYTIDSFTNNIFKKVVAPYLKVTPYEIINEDENSKIIIKTLEKLFDSKEDFELFRDFLVDNSEKDIDIYINLIKEIINQRWKMIVVGDNICKKEEFIYTYPITYLENIEKILQEIADIKEIDFFELLKKEVKGYFKAKDRLEFLKKNYSIFFKGEIWNKRKTSGKKDGMPEFVQRLNEEYTKFRENLAKMLFNDLVIPYEEKLLKVVSRIYEIYDGIKINEKKFTHMDISNYTFKYLEEKELGFLNESGLTEDFFEIIDGKMKTVFIDEFQDTSILQWRILKKIIDKSENIICVGDEKQSIYGWRGGEKKLFENLGKIIDGQEENLDTSYRSKKNIVEYTNDVFNKISNMSKEEYPQGQEWKFIDSKYKNTTGEGSVRCLCGDEDNDPIEMLTDTIKRDFDKDFRGIGILARTKNNLKEIALALGERGIPYTLETDTNIVEQEENMPLFFLISWLVKKDFVSLLDFLRSDVVDISARDVKKIIEKRESIEKYIYDDEDISEEFEQIEIIQRMKKIYEKYLENQGQTTLIDYEFLYEIGFGDLYMRQIEISNIYEFYRILRGYKYLDEFVTDFEENGQTDKFKKKSTGDKNSVTLMTIHKSKGLEFDTVFYYHSEKSRKSVAKGMQFYIELDSTFSELKSYLITDSKFNSILENIDSVRYLEEERIKQEHEEINNLYVTLTRPKNNLYVVIEDVEKKLANNIISEDRGGIIYSEKVYLQYNKNLDLKIDTSNLKYIYKVERDENFALAREKGKIYSLDLEEKRLRGIVVHYFLENIRNWNEEEIDFAKDITIKRYANLIGEEKIKKLLSQRNIEYIYEKCKDIFENSWDVIYNEYPISIKKEGKNVEYRLDRLMIKLPRDNKKGIIFIADYKTGKFDEEQIEGYIYATVQKVVESGESIEDYEVKSKYIEIDL